MSSAGLLPGMPINFSTALPKCDSCLLGKQMRSTVPKVRQGVHLSERLGLVYVDLMGPANVKSLSGNLYALHIIDDFTSYSWSISLPSKDAALRLFTSWATARMTETNLLLCAVQINNVLATKVISPIPSSVVSFAPPVTPIPPPLVPVALPSLVPPPLRHYSWVPVPSERWVAALDLPYSSTISHAVEASAAAGSCLYTAHTSHLPPLHPPAPSDPLAALLSSLADVPPALTLDIEYPGDPSTLAEAMASPFASQWCTALLDKFQSICDLHVYKLVPRSSVPSGCRIMCGRPVFHLKCDHLNVPVRFKARWVCQGFEAIFGQDYTWTSSPTVRMESFCALLHLATARNWEIHYIDVKTAFLYGLLPDDKTYYMEQPHGFEDPDHPDWVWKLLKGLYGMKQGGCLVVG
ncbi:uncharacterized protein FIBRA_09081 [Fibroporia radiculosa]|uniref:Reverse transcriptase Ty1/copia-type domain-containing protein n=1 Tax=Fibroporia radiculosa TaxID=599839 RepID=J4I3S7_9APHY|nr:uncharacterized protein FIBRA_09081 [Fibroporia radiculosa]CCM06782.1 predicted protein [Fibroporia radiculosa]